MAATKLKIKYVKSCIGRKQDQKDTIRGLGFRKLNDERLVPNTPEVRGMIKKVIHMLEVVEEI